MKKIINIKSIFVLILITAISTFAFAVKNDGVTPIPVGGMDLGSKIRLTFNWGKDIDFVAGSKSNKIFIRFDKPVQPDFSHVAENLGHLFVNMGFSRDKRTVVLRSKNLYKVRTFNIDNLVGIDLYPLGVDVAEADRIAMNYYQDNNFYRESDVDNLDRYSRLAPVIASRPMPGSEANDDSQITIDDNNNRVKREYSVISNALRTMREQYSDLQKDDIIISKSGEILQITGGDSYKKSFQRVNQANASIAHNNDYVTAQITPLSATEQYQRTEVSSSQNDQLAIIVNKLESDGQSDVVEVVFDWTLIPSAYRIRQNDDIVQIEFNRPLSIVPPAVTSEIADLVNGITTRNSSGRMSLNLSTPERLVVRQNLLANRLTVRLARYKTDVENISPNRNIQNAARNAGGANPSQISSNNQSGNQARNQDNQIADYIFDIEPVEHPREVAARRAEQERQRKASSTVEPEETRIAGWQIPSEKKPQEEAQEIIDDDDTSEALKNPNTQPERDRSNIPERIVEEDEKIAIGSNQPATKPEEKEEVELDNFTTDLLKKGVKSKSAGVADIINQAQEKLENDTDMNIAFASSVSGEEGKGNGEDWVFAWKKRVASSVFQRSGHLWVVFSERALNDVPEIISNLPESEFLEKPDILAGEYHIAFRYKIKKPFNYAVTKVDYNWKVELTPEDVYPKNYANFTELKIISRPKSAVGAHLLIPALQFTEPLRIRDPYVGDNLFITPLHLQGQGIKEGRNFVEFSVLPSMQGIAVQQKADSAEIRTSRLGVRVYSQEGLQLSLDMLAFDETSTSGKTPTLFPYDQWYQGDDTRVYEIRQEIIRQINKSTPEVAMLWHLRLAQIFLANGMGTEAKAVLDRINSLYPEFYEKRKLEALLAAANFLMYRFEDAAENLASENLQDIKELIFWRHAMDVAMGKSDHYVDYLGNYDDYIKLYPPKLKQRLAIIAADQNLRRGEYDDAKKIFKDLADANQLDGVGGYFRYLMGHIYNQVGQPEKAIEIWTELAAEDDRFIRARSDYSLIDLQLKIGEIDKQEAIDRLEGLRIVWRGDRFEYDLLARLGQYYMDNKNYAEAMRTWNEAVRNFPYEQKNLDITLLMADTFIELYNEGKADEIDVVKALALYYEFSALTPPGKQGDRMIQNLADRLVGVDLLGRSASLLEHQIAHRLEGEERSRVGARLALVYLMDRQPERALNVLSSTNFPRLSEKLREMRRYLRAKALADNNQLEAAWELLQSDSTVDALTLKVDIAWEANQWPQLIQVVEKKLAARHLIDQGLSEKESEDIVRLAVAYMMTENGGGLDFLRDAYMPLMDDGEYKQSLEFLTSDLSSVNPQNFARITGQIQQFSTFLSSYEKKVRDEGLSSAIN